MADKRSDMAQLAPFSGLWSTILLILFLVLGSHDSYLCLKSIYFFSPEVGFCEESTIGVGILQIVFPYGWFVTILY